MKGAENQEHRFLLHGLIVLILLFPATLLAQYPFAIHVTDLRENESLPGVTILLLDSAMNTAAVTDSAGLATFPSIPEGPQNFQLSMVGYFKKKIKVNFPQKRSDQIEEVFLEPSTTELEEVTVISTRTKIKAEELPTRVEVISEDEVAERMLDKPSDISHAVKEQPGVQLQRTSASSGMFNIRLQGLRGKYVQVLKDGFPVYGGLSQNISISQIPPLDIRQIEIIKGPASTLYGGDAIAGVINLISKEPNEKPVYDFLVSGETTKSVDVAAFASQQIKWFGYSLMAQYRNQQAKDWNVDSFSDIPKLDRWSVAPTLFFNLAKRTKLQVGANIAGEWRKGGAMPAIYGRNDTTFSYLEKNTTARYGGQLKLEHDMETKGKLILRHSTNFFSRKLQIYDYHFGGNQLSTISEINYQWRNRRHSVVAGIDFRTDGFQENKDTVSPRSYQFYTAGWFAQEIFTVNEKTVLEAGMRLDYNNRYHFFPLPHAAWLQKWNTVFHTRLNFAMGYKLPTVFQDEAESANFRYVQPIADSIKPERSIGGTLDFKVYVPAKNGWKITITELVFYTRIFTPLVASQKKWSNAIYFRSANGHIQSVGLESNLQVAYRGISLNVGYTLQDQSRYIEKVQSVAPLTSKHILSILAGYEMPNRFAVGLDCYYYSPQQLSNGNVTRGIWEMGLVAQLFFKWVNFFANLENILDIRQSRYAPIVTADPTFKTPRFTEVYAPLEGRVLNVGLKLKLGELVKTKKAD
ncbi:MAG: TonB-dependent receptor plug domain-containing protein [Chitinophagales bacterium]